MRRGLVLVWALSACAEPSGNPGGGTTDAGSTSPSTSGSMSSMSSMSSASSVSSGSTEVAMESSGGVEPGAACTIGADDCPAGLKCTPAQVMPFVIESVCVPIPDDPLTIGEACSIEGPLLGVGMSDPCDANSFCGSVGGALEEGECLELCTGVGAPCQLAGYSCTVAFDGAMQACFPECDPLGNDCQDDAGCYYVVLGDQFNCGPTLPIAGGYGDVCEGIQALCQDGHACYPEVVAAPGCDAQWCCTPFCDVEEPNMCPGMAGGEECVPIYSGGEGPPGLQSVGACVIPA